ncbi:low quality protein: protein [Lynx pardinus]|uniref:Low quality protein: protein n=1 Tax=Lynx pardinus TaxID=191816 RepID=A0A485M9J2_LYNPA|nr:low quality protein: protein [Lynx pardinus]
MSAGWFRRRFLPGGPLPAPRPPRPRSSPVPYRRPRFLRGSGSGPGTADAPRRPDVRPVRSPARGRALPWNAGYAEIINAEKSEFNEDQAACGQLCIRRCEFGAEEDQEWLTSCPEEFLTGHYWALFDGHGGPAAAILAANTLHSCLRRQLEAVVEGMVATQPPMHLSGHSICPSDPQFVEEKGIRAEDLVIGALESAFQECDEVIGRELEASGQMGGCTALVAVSLQGKLYVANAGDSRAILVRKDEVRPLSSEFTPETERQRIQQLAFVYPELLAGEFTRLEFPRRLKGDDLGQKVLFRDHHMRGWSYKCVEKSDLKYPLIHGQGRQVSEWHPLRAPLKLPPAEVGAPLSLLGAVAGVMGFAPRLQDVCPSTQGTQGPQYTSVCFACTFSGAVCCHLTSPLSPGSVTGNTGRLPGPGRPSAQSPGHKHSAQALLALCPTGDCPGCGPAGAAGGGCGCHGN